MDAWPADNIPFLTHFSELRDPRKQHNKRHRLPDILFVSVCAVLCGANHCVGIADFAKARLNWLRQFVPLKFEECFVKWTASIQKKTAGEVLPIDGKTVRRSFDKPEGRDAIHMVSAWGSANGVVLGQRRTDSKSNEITAIPELLKMLDVEGRIVTVDSMGTQKAIAGQIVEQKGDYVMALEGNHPNLGADVEAFFGRNVANHFMDGDADVLAHDFHQTVDADHGRIEIRRCWCSDVLGDIEGTGLWRGLRSVVMVESERRLPEKTTVERRYYLSSLHPNAKRTLEATRTHWSIENKLHWVLDVVFREDESRTRKGAGAQIKSALNKIVINLCKKNDRKMAVSRKRNVASWDEEFLEEIVTGSQKS